MNGIGAVGTSNALPSSTPDANKRSDATFRETFDAAAQQQQSTGKIADAARQFEALMIGQILKSAQGPEGWLGAGDDDETASTSIEMAEEYLGQAIANGGGLGIAKLVTQGLTHKESTRASSATPEQPATGPHTDLSK
jgi:Rod binding domain-containing protein